MPDLVVFGAGELARLARHYFESDSDYRVVAFAVDPEYSSAWEHEGLPLCSFDDVHDAFPPDRADAFVAIGYRKVNRGRAAVFDRARMAGYRLATYVNTRAIVSPVAEIGDNCFIFEGAIVQPFVTIGDDTIIWSGAVVAHDSVVGRHCFLAPMASVSGNAVVGDFSFIGNNATVRDGVRLGEATVVGAGAVAKWDTAPNTILRPTGTAPLDGRSSLDLDTL